MYGSVSDREDGVSAADELSTRLRRFRGWGEGYDTLETGEGKRNANVTGGMMRDVCWVMAESVWTPRPKENEN